jgi:hypothetical protein
VRGHGTGGGVARLKQVCGGRGRYPTRVLPRPWMGSTTGPVPALV